ncbi:uncharacterized protein LOC144452544 [Glandiceps talaboti]
MATTKTVIFVLLIAFLFHHCVDTQTCSEPKKGMIDGEVILGFLFPFHWSSNDQCLSHIQNFESIQLLEAALFALSRQNQHYSIPGVSVGLEAWDSCHSESISVDRGIRYLSDKIKLIDGEGNACSTSKLRIGMVAGRYNTDTKAVASLLGDAWTPQITYGGRSPDFSDGDVYPYLLRTVPSDKQQAKAMIDIMKRLGWYYVNAIYTGDDDHERAFQAFKDMIGDHDICLASQLSIKKGTSIDAPFDSFLRDDFMKKPNAKAVIAFVTQSHAARLLRASQRISSANFQFLFSYEGISNKIQLKQQAQNATRGLLGVVPQTLVNKVDDFETYYKALTPESNDEIANPWFAEYWREKYQCNLPGESKYSRACDQTVITAHQASYQQHEYVSPILNAVETFLQAVKEIHDELCGVSFYGICQAMQIIDKDQILAKLKNIKIDKPQSTSGEDVSYEQGEITAMYRIEHYDGSVFKQVGNWTSGTLNLMTNDISMWVDGVERHGSDLPTSVCLSPNCIDDSCGEQGEDKIYISGDIILGGLFPLHHKGTTDHECGVINAEGIMALEAMLYTLDKVNQDYSILPTIQLGMEAIDSCYSPEVASHETLRFLSTAEFGSSGSGERMSADTGNTEYIYGVIGGADNDVCKAVSEILQVYTVPEISYQATATALSNTWTYPNFLRTVPPSTIQIAAIVQVMAKVGWTYIQAVFSDNSFGWDGASVLRQQAPMSGICLTQYLKVDSPEDDSDMDTIIEKLLKRPNAKGVVVMGTEALVVALLKAIKRNNAEGSFFLMGTDTWGQLSIPSELIDVARGSVTLTARQRQAPQFVTHLTNMKPGDNVRNRLFSEFWMQKFQCKLPGYESSNYTVECTDDLTLTAEDIPLNVAANVMDAVGTFAYALDDLHAVCYTADKVCSDMSKTDGENLIEELKRVNFESLAGDGTTISFNYQGDDGGAFDIYNFIPEGSDFKYVKIGSYDNIALLSMTSEVKFYNTDGSEKTAPPTSDCIGACDDCKAIERTKVAEVKGGDIWIGGLFEMHPPGTSLLDCSDELIAYNVQLLEAFLFAVDEVNADNETLPNLKLGAVAFDTCGLVERAVRETTNFVTGGVEYRSGYPPSRVRVSGMIGGSNSDISREVAEILTPLQITQISYGATAKDLNNDEFKYFVRTVPSDIYQAEALTDVLKSLDWKYVSVVYSDNEYGLGMLQEFTRLAKDKGICIAANLRVDMGAIQSHFDSLVDSLEAQVQSKVGVLFTSDVHTGKLLQAAERKGLRDIQWFGTDTWGDRFFVTENATSTSQGAITLQFKKHTAQNFKDYFISLGPYSNQRNPWWQQWYMAHFECFLNVWGIPKPYDTPCPWSQDLSDGFAEEAGIGYVINSVWAFAKGMQASINQLCPNTTNHLCPEVVQNPDILNTKIKEAQFNGHGGEQFSFDEFGNGPASYDILNLQRVNGTLQYINVGGWEYGDLSLDPQDIKVYNSNNEVVSLPTSECSGRCLECIQHFHSLPRHVELQGELLIPGLFAVHEKGDHVKECGNLTDEGLIYVETMLHAIDDINANEHLLPGITLGTVIFDTCSSTSRAGRELSPLLNGAFFLNGDYPPSSFPVIAGVVGAGNDEIASVTIETADLYKYTMVSYGATTSLLSNQDVYPYFLRTVPSDDQLADVLVQLVLDLGWSYISVVRSHNQHSKAGMQSFMNKATEKNVCIATVLELGVPVDYQRTIDKLSEYGDRGVVILFTNGEDSNEIIQRSKTANQNYVWVLTDDAVVPDMTQSSLTNLEGSLFITLDPLNDQSTEEYISQLRPNDNERNPWFAQYWQDTFQCNLPGNDKYGMECTGNKEMSSTDNTLVGYVKMAVNAIAEGMHDLLVAKCGSTTLGLCSDFISASPEEFYQSIENAGFNISNQRFNFIDGHGPEKYQIWNSKKQTGQLSKVASWTEGHLTIAMEPEIKDVPSVPDVSCNGVNCPMCIQQMFKSVTTPKPDQKTDLLPSTKPGDTSTKQLPTAKSSSTAKSFVIEKSKQPFILDKDHMWGIIVICLTIVGVVCSAIILTLVLCQLNHIVIRESSSSLNVLLLIGLILLYLSCLAFVAEDTTISCGVRRFTLGFFHAMCFAALFVKAVRVYRIGKHERRISGPKAKFISAFTQTIFYGGVMLSELLLVVEWLLVDPPGVIISDDRYVCNQGMHAFIASLLYVFLLLLVTTVVAFRARNQHHVFNEALHILIVCIGSILIIISWAVVVLIGPQDYQKPAICFGIFFNSTLILFMMFTPKIKLILLKHEFFDNASMTSDMTLPGSKGRDGSYQNPTYNVYGEDKVVDSDPHDHHNAEKQMAEKSKIDPSTDYEDIDTKIIEHSTTEL